MLKSKLRSSKIKFMMVGILAVYLFILCSSCRKDKNGIVFTELHSGIAQDLNSIYFIDDSTGYACGGDRYLQGNILKTTNGGETWMPQGENLEKTLYRINFFLHDTGFITGFDGKIFRTYNGGASWELYQLFLYHPVHDVFMADNNTGFCCGGDGYKNGFVCRTLNGGDEWGLDTFSMELRSLYFLDPLHGLVAGYGAIFKTSDGGNSWQITSAKGDFFQSIYFTDELTGFAVGYEGSILKTTDGGEKWDNIRNGNNLLQPTKHFRQIVFRDHLNGFIIGEDGCFMTSTDAGEHWRDIENTPVIDWNGIFLTAKGGYLCGSGGKIFRFGG